MKPNSCGLQKTEGADASRRPARPAGPERMDTMTMINRNERAELSGQPVRADHRTPGATGPRPGAADAIIVAPMTYGHRP
jgi:hypothetical protein